MEHVAIDLGGRESQVCVRSANGEIIEQRRIRTDAIEVYLSQRPPSRVVVETCAEAFTVADGVRRLGHEIRVVPATLAPSLGVGARRHGLPHHTKTRDELTATRTRRAFTKTLLRAGYRSGEGGIRSRGERGPGSSAADSGVLDPARAEEATRRARVTTRTRVT